MYSFEESQAASLNTSQEALGGRYTAKMLSRYDDSRVRTAHIKKIRSYLNIKPADKRARSKALEAMEHAAYTKEDIVDILNVGVEELVRLRFELPKFDHLLRMAYKARKKTNSGIYRRACKTGGGNIDFQQTG